MARPRPPRVKAGFNQARNNDIKAKEKEADKKKSKK